MIIRPKPETIDPVSSIRIANTRPALVGVTTNGKMFAFLRNNPSSKKVYLHDIDPATGMVNDVSDEKDINDGALDEEKAGYAIPCGIKTVFIPGDLNRLTEETSVEVIGPEDSIDIDVNYPTAALDINGDVAIISKGATGFWFVVTGYSGGHYLHVGHRVESVCVLPHNATKPKEPNKMAILEKRRDCIISIWENNFSTNLIVPWTKIKTAPFAGEAIHLVALTYNTIAIIGGDIHETLAEAAPESKSGVSVTLLDVDAMRFSQTIHFDGRALVAPHASLLPMAFTVDALFCREKDTFSVLNLTSATFYPVVFAKPYADARYQVCNENLLMITQKTADGSPVVVDSYALDTLPGISRREYKYNVDYLLPFIGVRVVCEHVAEYCDTDFRRSQYGAFFGAAPPYRPEPHLRDFSAATILKPLSKYANSFRKYFREPVNQYYIEETLKSLTKMLDATNPLQPDFLARFSVAMEWLSNLMLVLVYDTKNFKYEGLLPVLTEVYGNLEKYNAPRVGLEGGRR